MQFYILQFFFIVCLWIECFPKGKNIWVSLGVLEPEYFFYNFNFYGAFFFIVIIENGLLDVESLEKYESG